MEVSVVCSSYDYGETSVLKGIKLTQWNFTPSGAIYYLQPHEQRYLFIQKLIKARGVDVIYLNGLFSKFFFMYPIIAWHLYFKKHVKLIISPRGMLQKGALEGKAFKKKFFISTFKIFQLHKGVEWHATDEQEAIDLREHFGQKQVITIVSNIPKKPLGAVSFIPKRSFELRLVYLSLISLKKNLLVALQLLKTLNLPVLFHIYGPIKDKQYWDECKQFINSLPAYIVVQYLGEVEPDQVQGTFSGYHALLLPTKGENFGHAIYECLSAGRPVIISDQTPWQNLERLGAGFDIAQEDKAGFLHALSTFYKMGQNDFNCRCMQAYSTAKDYLDKHEFKKDYLEMFCGN